MCKKDFKLPHVITVMKLHTNIKVKERYGDEIWIFQAIKRMKIKMRKTVTGDQYGACIKETRSLL